MEEKNNANRGKDRKLEIKRNKAINGETSCKRGEIRGNKMRQGRLLGSQAEN